MFIKSKLIILEPPLDFENDNADYKRTKKEIKSKMDEIVKYLESLEVVILPPEDDAVLHDAAWDSFYDMLKEG